MKQLYLFTFFVFLFSSSQAQDFEFFIRTTTPNETFTIPAVNGLYTYDYNVEIIQPFGGNTLATYNNVTGSLTHTFANPNTYLIKILEDSIFPALQFALSPDRDKITNIARWGNNEWATMERAFENCTNLTLGASNTPNLTNVTSTNKMFKNATSLVDFQDKIGDWDMSNVRDMEQMFRDCSSFNEDLSNWDTSNVQILHRIFQGATPFDQDLGNWDVSNVTGTAAIFRDTALSTSNYDKIIIGWGTLDSGETQIPTGLSIRADATHYCTSEAVRTTLSNAPYNWVFTDAGPDCSAVPNDDFFITTWETTAANETITIPTALSGTYGYYVDWGDGQTDNSVTGTTSHTYSDPGEHIVKIGGIFPRILFNNTGDKLKIKTIEQWGNIVWRDMSNAFHGCENLTINATDAPNLTNVTSFFSAFRTCFNIGSPDLNHWDVSNINTMANMFFASNFNGNITNWDVGNVSTFGVMFANTPFNQDIGNWNIGERVPIVLSMTRMFNRNSAFNFSLNTWDISKVLSTKEMFEGATNFNQSLASWDISSVTNMVNMFSGSGMSLDNYDATLLGWATLDAGETQIPSDIDLGEEGLEYCEAIEARLHLQNDYNWTFSGATLGCPEEDTFIMVWKTTTTNEGIKLQLAGSNNFYHVDWGDGSASQENIATHTYTQPGTYEVKLTGDFRLQYNNLPADTSTRLKLYEIKQWGTNPWSNTAGAFYGCENLKITATDVPDLSQVTSMENMFRNCYALEDIGGKMGSWDVSNVQDFNAMFENATLFSGNFGNWDISNASSMDNFLTGTGISTINYDITLMGWGNLDTPPSDINFNGGNSTYCAGSAAHEILDNNFNWSFNDGGEICDALDPSTHFVTSWETTTLDESISIPTTGSGYLYTVDWGDGIIEDNNTTDATHTYETPGVHEVRIYGSFPRIYFNNTGDKDKLLRIKQWGTNPWATMFRAFYGCTRLELDATDIPNFSITTNLRQMFHTATALKDNGGVINTWDVSNIKSMFQLFQLSGFNENINDWDVSNVENMRNLFAQTTNFNQPLDKWDLASATQLDAMFGAAQKFNQNISGWDLSNVISLGPIFRHTVAFNQDISGWDTSNVENFAQMFASNSVFNQDITGWDMSSAKDLNGMFTNNTIFNQDISGWDTSKVENMSFMFFKATAFDQDLGDWDISSLTNASSTFRDANLSTTNYDNLLNGWSTLSANEIQIPRDIFLGADGLQYCNATSAHNLLRNTYGWSIDDEGANCNIKVKLRMFLEGAAINPNIGEEALMRDDIRSNSLLSSTSPYSDGLTTNSSITFRTTGAKAIVDWVWITLRDASDRNTVIEGRSALLLRDGTIVEIDGVTPIDFSQSSGNYYISIDHRNHLPIMTDNSVNLSLDAVTLNFTDNPSLTLGETTALSVLPNGKYAMIAGDIDSNGQVQNADISNANQSLGSSGYNNADADMNGQVQNSDIQSIILPNSGKGQQF